LDVRVKGKGARVDDAHVEPRFDGVEEEDAVHRLSHLLHSSEGERDIGDASRDMATREILLQRSEQMREKTLIMRAASMK